ncbi:MAG: S8 family peptidase, partial [Bacteroidetes bacterium]|nr:S8 family peptidase [Bacteroidota bacterium]
WNSGEAYLWSSGSFSNEVKGNDYKSAYLNGNNEHTIGENGGSGNSTITAGAYVTRNVWTDDRNNPRDNKGQTLYTNATFTSRGPRVDGFMKPNVSAPGSEICAPLHNRQLPGWLFDRVLCRDSIKGAWNYYGVLQGTSMASPHVAGIAALMLEADPSLSPANLRKLLEQSARQDEFTGKVPNGIFGYGKVDALGALMAVKTLSDGNKPEHPMQWQLWPNPAQGGSVSIRVPELWKGNVQLQLFDLNGRMLERREINAEDQINLSTAHLPAGTYTLRLQHRNYSAARLLLLP